MYYLRAVAVWLLIIVAESIHGTLRQLFLVPRVGEIRARHIGFLFGIAIIFAIAYFAIDWMRSPSRGALFAGGAIWAILTLGFEIVLGRFAMGLAWERIAEDYDPRRGGLMAFGLIFLFFAPYLAAILSDRRRRGATRE